MHSEIKFKTIRQRRDEIFVNEAVNYTFDPSVKITLKGEVQSRIIIISKERVKISLQIGANMMKIG